ncbi:MAG: DUF1127 domain-containing protein [Burkholderiales bacterium]|nr:DUF1127 domain-containing protein [Burkholderiales bacterium]
MRAWLRRVVVRVLRHLRQRRDTAALQAMDERGLHDIGVARSDLPAIASGAYLRDGSRRQRGARRCADRLA